MTRRRQPVDRRRRLLGVAVAALLLGAWVAPPAAAHNALRSTNPTADARVERTPAEIGLTFDEPAIAMGTRIVVTGPSGPVQRGAPRLVDNTVSQPLQPGAPAGRYLVEWRVTSTDGHPVTGTFAFTSASAGSPGPPDWRLEEPADPAAPTPAGSSLWIAAAAVVVIALLAGVVVLLARGRRSRSDRQPRSPDDTIAARDARDPVPTSPPPSDRTEDDSR